MLSKRRKCELLILILCFLLSTLSAQEFEKRRDSPALLDPKGVCLSGAGQDGVVCYNSFDNYWRTAPEGQKPVLYMDYMDIWNMRPDWSNDLKSKLLRYHRQGFYVIPQMGLNIEHQYKDIGAGNMEKEIDNFIAGLKYLGIPMYLRIGYEFNNGGKLYGGNNRDPEGYIKCFQVLASKIKEAGIEVATVWDASLSGETNLIEEWYPGDEYVDWYGFNTFSDIYGGQHAITIEMVTAAVERNKPVLIGESSPQWLNGSNTGSLDWFETLYKMVGEQPTIKALGYINWDWDVEDMIAGNMGFGWGDARLEAFPKIKDYFFEQLENPGYFHASSEKEFRALLDYDDKVPPAAVTGLKREGDSLVWNDVNDNEGSKLAHYTIYKDKKLWDYIVGTKYPVRDLGLGDGVAVQVLAVDRAGNEGAKSNSLNVKQLNKINLIENGNFDFPMTSIGFDWTFRTANDGGVSDDKFVINDSGMITGPYAGEVDWDKLPTNPKVWKIQFYQEFPVENGDKIDFSFKLRAKDPISATVGFIANSIDFMNTHYMWGNDLDFENEWHKFNMWEIEIGTDAKEYKFSGTADRQDIARLTFMFGNSETPTTVWVDDVTAIIRGSSRIQSNPVSSMHGYQLHQNVPNPISKTTAITYVVPNKSFVTLSIHRLNGRKVTTLMSKQQSAGTYTKQWNTEGLPSGIYLYRLQTKTHSLTKKCLIKR